MKVVNFSKLFKPKHYNKWVALDSDKTKVVAYGESLKEVVKKALKKGEEDPVVTVAIKNYSGFVTYEN